MSASFPLANERPIMERPPWEPQSRFEVEKELGLLRSRDKTLGSTLAWVVDALLQDEGGAPDAERMRSRKREALETLSYVRDVLMTSSMVLDNDRLLGAEEAERRVIKAQKQREELQAVTAAAALNLPSPASLRDSHSKMSSRRQQSGISNPLPFRNTVVQSTIPPGVILRPPPTSTTLRRGKKSEDYVDPLGALK